MTLTDLYEKIQEFAMGTQTVQSFKIGDPYVVLNSLHIQYPIVMTALNYIRYQDNVIEAHISLYYAAKQANDSSDIYNIQDTAFDVIHNILKHLVDNYELDGFESIEIHPFTQKFADICSGAYADATVLIPNDENCFYFDKE